MADTASEGGAGAPASETSVSETLLSLFQQTLEGPTVIPQEAATGAPACSPDAAAVPSPAADDVSQDVRVRALLPTLQRELQETLLFLRLPAAWAALSGAGPPFLVVEFAGRRPHGPSLPQPETVERLLGSVFVWPGPGEVTELSLPSPEGTDPPRAFHWWVGEFATGDPTSEPAYPLYLHLVASLPTSPPQDLKPLVARWLQRLSRVALAWTRVRQLQRQAHLGHLLGVVAHEVRNPLATVRASLQLGRTAASPSLRPFMDQAIREVDQTVRFMELLLQAARPRAASPEPLDLAHLVEETLQVYAGVCHAQHVESRIVCPARLPRVVASAVLLRQALGNLVRNAIEAMPRGGKLTVTLRRRGADRVEIVVADTGPGLSEEAQKRLFQPFHTSKPGGTGLGLSLVKQIALAHGGDVTVRSRPGAGAAFILTLPVAREDHSRRVE